MRYRAAAPDTLLSRELDMLVAVFHRSSGITHLLASPAPEILQALAAEPLDRDGLLAKLGEAFELGDGGADALAARLDELVAAGLVEALPVATGPVAAA
ncbi:HPr-rel-A system PqqD family peptide chaperone [Sphingomonas sp. S6]|jgi:PqqD family protein of HPr-rel-A system|uniref:HPr-rel-A system PqqD family peptide chaperone n=1 Tax=Sphingomonas sp. S6 TaxID=3368600 RepID=UPI000FB6A52E|nr:HPr-rel-A system PqqD family peptide chaperone [uncultured Sphingomonas sp.]RTL16292.1 MAG: HPr-rel-A system PqqD family peptide chaperone [Sphingomonadaceae bacterium]